jgi:ABC-type antimicrobial peptide transport system permease subunit
MLKNYIKIAWRNLLRHKSYAYINILGLSLGIACSILIFVVISFHLSFDDFHPNKERIFRVVTEFHQQDISYSPGVPPPFAKAFRDDYPFVEKSAKVVVFSELVSIPGDNKKFYEDHSIAVADPDFFKIFNFPLVQGDINNALTSANTAIITERIAQKYFGNSDPIGKVIRIDNRTDFKITGILKNLPLNTDRKQEIYLSYLNMKDLSSFFASDEAWGGNSDDGQCFVVLKSGTTPAQAEAVFPQFLKKYFANDIEGQKTNRFKLQPLADVHFNPHYEGFVDKKYLWALVFIGFFLIVTACVNFINLATAQALNRSKEIGIRKVLGSTRSPLFWQFIVETMMITLFSILFAYVLAILALPFLERLHKTELTVNPFSHPGLVIFTLIVFVIVVFLSGAFPGLVLSRFAPIVALKGKLTQKNVGGMSVRRMLVVVQFAITQMLIFGSIVIANQIRFSKTSDLGFRKDGIVMLPIPISDSVGNIKMKSLRSRLASLAGVEDVSLCYQAPASEDNKDNVVKYYDKPNSEKWAVNVKDADDHYLSLFNLKLVAGRNLFRSDTLREYLVNETLVSKLGLSSPNDILNKKIVVNGNSAPVVGVVKDFYNNSFRGDVQPVAIFSDREDYQNCAVKINMVNSDRTMEEVRNIWNDIYPQFLYEYHFLDDRIARFYELDDLMLKSVEWFAGIAIFIGCLGLYGLVTFMALSKTKEIAIRKAIGASVQSIIWIFGREFSRLLIIAFLIAAPVSWWIMQQYLLDFKYRITISFEVFLLVIGSTFLVAALTAGYRSLKASLANPAQTLRID